MIWLSLLVPIMVAILAFILMRKQYTWWELGLPIIAGVLVILMFKGCGINSLTKDTVYHGALITKARYYEYWSTYVKKQCHYDVCTSRDDKGNCTSSTRVYYDCSYCDENSAYWEAYDTEGNTWRITEQYYNHLKQRWKATPKFIELDRDIVYKKSERCGDDGDAYEIVWNGDVYTSEPSTFDVTYKNKVQASKNAFKYTDISEKEATEKGLFPYPEIRRGYTQDAVLGLENYTASLAHKDSVQKLFRYFNGKYGHELHVRLFILITKNKSQNFAHQQEAYWVGGNRNELTICIDVNEHNKINWVKAFSWCDNKRLLVDSREDIAELDTLNLLKAFPYIHNTVATNYKPKDFEEFDYLTIAMPRWAVVCTWIFMFLVTSGIMFWGAVNEWLTPNQTNKINDMIRKKDTINTFDVRERIGWGNSFLIETTNGTYDGIGRCMSKNQGIINRRPSLAELQKVVTISGHCSTPYVKNGDHLIVDSNMGELIKMVFRNVRYCKDPHDMFFADLEVYREPEPKLSLITRIRKFLNI